jgi:hypothetical protein
MTWQACEWMKPQRGPRFRLTREPGSHDYVNGCGNKCAAFRRPLTVIIRPRSGRSSWGRMDFREIDVLMKAHLLRRFEFAASRGRKPL